MARETVRDQYNQTGGALSEQSTARWTPRLAAAVCGHNALLSGTTRSAAPSTAAIGEVIPT
jgi:hypothetical protein